LPAPTGHPTGFVESRPPVSEKKPRAGLPKTHSSSYGGRLIGTKTFGQKINASIQKIEYLDVTFGSII
jgi:hypothetical protein